MVLMYGIASNILIVMKMTIDIDEHALKHFMATIGVKSKKKAVNEAIRLADRIACKQQLFAETLSSEKLKNAIDPAYDLSNIREKDAPH